MIEPLLRFPASSTPPLELTDEDLKLEQLPLILTQLSPREVTWKYGGELLGPDGTRVKVRGEGNYVIRTPVNRSPIPWSFPELDPNHFRLLVRDLIPCREGEAILNPSPWRRKWVENGESVIMEPGEITEAPKKKDHGIAFLDGEVKISTNFYNPLIYYQNPYYVNYGEKIGGPSTWFSVELENALLLASAHPIHIQLERGVLLASSKGKIASWSGLNWKEAKPFQVSWDMQNEPVSVECVPPSPISIYRLEPSTVIPVHLEYRGGELTMGLLNLSDSPVMSKLTVIARILEASTLGPTGQEMEKLFPELDTLRIPIRRWGVVFFRARLKKLLNVFLRKYYVA
ncbi:hypothetical protein HS1genome_1007 [Sulfodiicoccus acidiphilus]|uniref:Uncharacterized protein n=1 Tax=Sulfodiicoccus acidiphilus TaxID=1670455 RepID=A0A348B366_9CREN|nr:hypothetical protein [Sulfodiicoccus acidiphilus]BBD72618.1 hypothetical protein HS1genome_1007 [Sulfodiicoccus acidiphilus]